MCIRKIQKEFSSIFLDFQKPTLIFTQKHTSPVFPKSMGVEGSYKTTFP